MLFGSRVVNAYKLQDRTDIVVRGATKTRRFAAGGIHQFAVAAGNGHRFYHQTHAEFGGYRGSRYARGRGTGCCNGIRERR